MNEMTCTLRRGKTIRELAHSVEDYLTFEQGMRCEVLRTESGEYIVQAKGRHDEITQWVGMNRRISVRFTPAGGSRVEVMIEKGKQETKFAALAVGLLFFWAVAFTALSGLLRQCLLTHRTGNFIRRWVE